MAYDYNEISNLYDDVREADLKTVEYIIDCGKVHSGSRVLEIGCGTGNYLRLIEELTGAEVWGMDRSYGMLEKAGEKCKKAVLVEDDAVELSKINSSYFDLVFMVDVIHHIPDIDSMFANINRVLKPGGIVMIFSDSHEHIRKRLTTKYFPETLEGELGRYQDIPEIKEKLSQKGFGDISNGTVEIGTDFSYGPRLIEIASKKGYSMFGAISDEAIEQGIERIKADMEHQPIVYHQEAPYVTAIRML
jgi:ubiquinone/menaquinone biosynthesis C-methylase UbiE